MKISEPYLLNIGCGLSRGASWLNFDCSPTLLISKIPFLGMPMLRCVKGLDWPADVRFGDVVKGLPVRKESCKFIFCSHVLEHLSLKDFHVAVSNIYMYLMRGGIFRIIVPDLEAYAREYLSNLNCSDAAVKAADDFMRKTHLGCEKSRSGILLRIREAMANSRHQWLWDRHSLSAALKAYGFSHVKICAYGEWSDPMCSEIEDHGRHMDSICFEAMK